MRDAKASDYWRHVYEYSEKKLYKNYISKLIVNDCNGFTGEVEMSPGITILCGLNGVGKSSLIANIKDSLGLSDSSIVSKNKWFFCKCWGRRKQRSFGKNQMRTAF